MIRHLYTNSNQSIKLYEHNPTKRTLHIYGRDYFLPFPYLVFGLAYGQSESARTAGWQFYAFASLKPIKSPYDFVFVPPLPNSYIGGQVCMGSDFFVSDTTNINKCIKHYFSSAFDKGVGHGNNAWASAKDWWDKYSDPFTLTWPLIEKFSLARYFDKFILPDPFNPDFTDERIREVAGQIKDQYPEVDDKDCWLAAEEFLLNQQYQRCKQAV